MLIDLPLERTRRFVDDLDGSCTRIGRKSGQGGKSMSTWMVDRWRRFLFFVGKSVESQRRQGRRCGAPLHQMVTASTIVAVLKPWHSIARIPLGARDCSLRDDLRMRNALLAGS